MLQRLLFVILIFCFVVVVVFACFLLSRGFRGSLEENVRHDLICLLISGAICNKFFSALFDSFTSRQLLAVSCTSS